MKPGAFKKILDKAQEDEKEVIDHEFTCNKYKFTGYVIDGQPYLVSYLTDKKGEFKPAEAVKVKKGRRITAGNIYVINDQDNLGIPFFEKDGTDNRDFIEIVEAALLKLEEEKKMNTQKEKSNIVDSSMVDSSAAEELKMVEKELDELDGKDMVYVQHDQKAPVEEEQIPGLVPVGAPRREKTAAQTKVENERYVQEMILENQRKKVAQEFAQKAAILAAQKDAEERMAHDAKDAQQAAAKANYYASKSNQNSNAVTKTLEEKLAAERKAHKAELDSKDRKYEIDTQMLANDLAKAEQQRDEDMNVLGAEIDRQDEVINSQNKKIKNRNVGLKYCALAAGILVIAGVAAGVIWSATSKKDKAEIDVTRAKEQATIDAAANFAKVKDSDFLIYEDEATAARATNKVPTGINEAVAKQLKNVSYQGVSDSAKAAYDQAYSEAIGTSFGKAVISEIYANSYDWMKENVLDFNEDGSIKKDANGAVVKAYAFENEFAAKALSADDFKVGYEAGFSVQLGIELSGNEITGGSSIEKPDEETVAALNSPTWKTALVDFLKNSKGTGFEVKDQNIKEVKIADSGDKLFVFTGDSVYKVEFAKDGNNLIDEDGNIAKINEANAEGLVNAATLTGNWQTFENSVKSLIEGRYVEQKTIDKCYQEAKEKFGLTSKDQLQICVKVASKGQNGTAQVNLLYIGTKGDEIFEETESKTVINKDGKLVHDGKAALVAVTGDSSRFGFNYVIGDSEKIVPDDGKIL